MEGNVGVPRFSNCSGSGMPPENEILNIEYWTLNEREQAGKNEKQRGKNGGRAVAASKLGVCAEAWEHSNKQVQPPKQRL